METLEFSELIFNDLKSTVETLEKCPCTFIWFFFIVYSKQVFAILNFFIFSLYIKENARDQSSFPSRLAIPERGHSFNRYAKFSEKLIFVTPWCAHVCVCVIRICAWYAYVCVSGVRNVSFSKIVAYILHEWSQMAGKNPDSVFRAVKIVSEILEMKLEYWWSFVSNLFFSLEQQEIQKA